MKQIVKSLPVPTVVLDNVNPDRKYYGAFLERSSSPTKGYFRQCSWESERWNLFPVDSFNFAAGFGFHEDSLKESIARVLSTPGNVVYEFDTLTELFTWLEKP